MARQRPSKEGSGVTVRADHATRRTVRSPVIAAMITDRPPLFLLAGLLAFCAAYSLGLLLATRGIAPSRKRRVRVASSEAEAFLGWLQCDVWPSREAAPGLIGDPQTRIVETVESKKY
jgi:hypothetical protein